MTTTTPPTTPPIVAHLILPRRYCSDASCGGVDCTECYGPHAEVGIEVFVGPHGLADQLVAEVLDGGVADDHVVLGAGGVTAGAIRQAVWTALNPTRYPAEKPASNDTASLDASLDDLLPW